MRGKLGMTKAFLDATAAACANVKISLHSGDRITPNHSIRVRCQDDEGREYGVEVDLAPGSDMTVGLAVDRALGRLLENIVIEEPVMGIRSHMITLEGPKK